MCRPLPEQVAVILLGGCSSLLPVGTNPGFQLFLLCHNSVRGVSLYFRMFYRWSFCRSAHLLQNLQNLVNQIYKCLTYTKKQIKLVEYLWCP